MAEDGETGGFDESFRERLHALFAAADVPGPVADTPLRADSVDTLMRLAETGLATRGRVPWRVVPVDDPDVGARIVWNFEVCNADALAHRHSRAERATAEHAALCAAPVQRAVFAEAPAAPSRPSDVAPPEAVRETAAAAVAQLRLAARAAGLRAVWITVMDAQAVRHTLGMPAACPFVGYLCLGYPAQSENLQTSERAGDDRT